jgi:ATP-dependent Clp protease ATP-binding subunit ClpC
MKEKLLEEVKRTFKPEFLNRIDDTIVFRPLNKEDLIKIIDIEISFVAERLKEHNISLEVNQEAKEFLVEKGFDPIFGARPLKRTIQRFLEDSLASEIIAKNFKDGSKVKVIRKNLELAFEQ